MFTVLGGKFKFSAQDSILEHLSWRSKNPPVSSDLKPPLQMGHIIIGFRRVCLLCMHYIKKAQAHSEWLSHTYKLSEQYIYFLFAQSVICMYSVSFIVYYKDPVKSMRYCKLGTKQDQSIFDLCTYT